MNIIDCYDIIEVSSFAKFMNFLKKKEITNPDFSVVSKIGANANLLDIASFNTEYAVDIYRRVKEIPGTKTCNQIGALLGMIISSPINDDYCNILTAVDLESGKDVMVKVLREPEDAKKKVQIRNEIDACTLFKHAGIVPMECREVDITKELAAIASCRVGNYNVIVMPWYKTTLHVYPKCNYPKIATQGEKILNAVLLIHEKGWVHMDIKELNVFVDENSNWYLGDFGSCVKINEAHTSSTCSFWYEEYVMSAKGETKYDFFMLLIMILMQTLNNPGSYITEFYDTGCSHANFHKVIKYAENFNADDGVKSLINKICIRLQNSLKVGEYEKLMGDDEVMPPLESV